MPYTIPFAEIIGGVVGIAVGRFCARYGRQFASEMGVPEIIGGVAGATLGHYLSGTVTKVCINAMGADAIGMAVSAGVTTPITAISHGLIEGFGTALHDMGLNHMLDNIDIHEFIGNFLSSADAQPYLQALSVDSTHDTISQHIDNGSSGSHLGQLPHFSGSVQPIDAIADLQGHLPTCGLETLENMIQAKLSVVDNHLSDRIIQSGWYNPDYGGFPIQWYQGLLAHFGINSEWVDASPQTLWDTVCGADTTAAVVGDPYMLNPSLYGHPGELHAITLTRGLIDQNGRPVGFEGIDSNVGKCHWSFDQIQQFVDSARTRLGAFGGKTLRSV